MNATTTVLSTIPSTPAAPASTEPVESGSTPETTEEPPVTTPASTEPDPDLEVARRFDEVARREARARKVESELQAMRKEAEESKAEMARMRAELEEALDDPIAHYVKKGKDPVEIAKRFARPVTEEEKRLAKLEERYAKDEEAKTQREKEAETKAARDAHGQRVRQFVSEITTDEYPYLTSMHDANEVPKLVDQLLTRAADPSDPESPTVLQAFKSKHGRVPTNKEIRETLEHEAELRATRVMERVRPKAPAASQVTPETPPATSGSPSLSNQHASNTSSGSSRTKSRAELKRQLLDAVEAGATPRE